MTESDGIGFRIKRCAWASLNIGRIGKFLFGEGLNLVFLGRDALTHVFTEDLVGGENWDRKVIFVTDRMGILVYYN